MQFVKYCLFDNMEWCMLKFDLIPKIVETFYPQVHLSSDTTKHVIMNDAKRLIQQKMNKLSIHEETFYLKFDWSKISGKSKPMFLANIHIRKIILFWLIFNEIKTNIHL